MKKSLLFASLIWIIIFGCSKKEKPEPKINYDGSAYVKFISSNVIDSINVETVFWSYFPNIYGVNRKKIAILGDGNYYLEIKMTIPALVEFTINKEAFTTYLIPGDTLEIRLKQESLNPNNINTSYFIDDEIFKYYQKKFKEFGYYMIIDNHGPLRLRWFMKMITTQKQLDNQLAETDSVQKRNIDFLEKNRMDLPEWFVTVEKNNIIYSIAQCKLTFWGSYTNFAQKLNNTVNVPIYNQEAHLSFEYYRFISSYYFHGYPLENKIKGIPRMISILNKEYSGIDSSLQGEIKSFFLTGVIDELYSRSKSDSEAGNVDTFVKSHNFKLTPEALKYIDNEREIAYNRRFDLASLKPGDNAPEFELKDLNGTNHNLSDFKGKIIYLHFWATWCSPCVGELPVLNSLIKDVNNNKVVFINVCLDNEYNKWKKIISENNLLGLNLLCDDTWSKKMNFLYKISSIPHYTLIDEKGLIIKNNCVRPGNVTNEISQLLDKK
jgi:peroxiredoxin